MQEWLLADVSSCRVFCICWFVLVFVCLLCLLFDAILADAPGLCRTDILKLKDLPNDGFETSRGALRLGIRTLLGLS